MQKRFSLKIEGKIKCASLYLINSILEQVHLEHANRSTKRTKTTGTFWATEIARGGGLDGNRRRGCDPNRPPHVFGKVKGNKQLPHIPKSWPSKLGKKVERMEDSSCVQSI
jgi:hypothetical protein